MTQGHDLGGTASGPPDLATADATAADATAGDPDCLFCRMVSGDVAADEVVRTATVLAFRDISPKAPTHVLVVPTAHHRDVAALASADPGVLGEMAAVAADVARRECPGGWRWVFNTGADGGQSVSHVHGHVLGGRRLTWPPG